MDELLLTHVQPLQFLQEVKPFFFFPAAPKQSNDQQLQEIKEVVEEAELAQTMIHSLAQVAGCPIVTSSRRVPGSSSIASNPLLRAKSFHDR